MGYREEEEAGSAISTLWGMGVWEHGSMGAWGHGGMGAWGHGSMVYRLSHMGWGVE